jgi:S-formylglutathione hydrolase
MQQLAANKLFDGQQLQFTHRSDTLDCDMVFSLYLPPQAETHKVPVLYWLSGLTCTDQNFVTKAGAQRYAAKHGMAIVCPDTSPRGNDVVDASDEAWDLGKGAGFYLNATQHPWSKHYQMYDYVVDELPSVLNAIEQIDTTRCSISGHSMGGHGALVIALRNPQAYQSASAFSPIVSPINCPWGQNAFRNYLGDDTNAWRDYDSCELLQRSAPALPIMVDQGSADDFLEEQLKTSLLAEASDKANYPVTIRYLDGYDHSYYFIASFIEEHIAFHAQHLSA